MRKKGQGAFEYVLLLGGVLLIVVLAVVLLRGGLFQSSSENVELAACNNALVTAAQCFNSTGGWDSAGVASVSSSCETLLNNGTAAPNARCGADGPGEGNCWCGESPV